MISCSLVKNYFLFWSAGYKLKPRN